MSDDLTIPEFLRRKKTTGENMNGNHAQAEFDAARAAEEIKKHMMDSQQSVAVPTIEEVTAAIRKLTEDIENNKKSIVEKEVLRKELRVKLRKMANDI